MLKLFDIRHRWGFMIKNIFIGLCALGIIKSVQSMCYRELLESPVLYMALQVSHSPEPCLFHDDEPTPLMKAVLSTESLAAPLSHSNQAIINEKRGHGVTALHLAAKKGAIEAMTALLEAGADPNASLDEDSHMMATYTPLHFVAYYQAGPHECKIPLVKLLLKQGAFVEGRNTETPSSRFVSPLHVAAQKGDCELIDELCLSGAYINRQTPTGKTPIQLAASKKHIQAVEKLLSRSADVTIANDQQVTLLHILAQYAPVDLLQKVLEQGAAVDAPDTNGQTPLMYAARGKNIGAIHILLLWGANIQAIDNEKRTVLMHLCIGRLDTFLEELQFSQLILRSRENEPPTIEEKQLSISEQRTKLKQLLNAYYDIVVLLFTKGAPVQALDTKEKTELMHALANENLILAYLFYILCCSYGFKAKSEKRDTFHKVHWSKLFAQFYEEQKEHIEKNWKISVNPRLAILKRVKTTSNIAAMLIRRERTGSRYSRNDTMLKHNACLSRSNSF